MCIFFCMCFLFFFYFILVCLLYGFTSLFSKEWDKEGINLEEWGSGEALGEKVGKIMIRICCLKIIFSKNRNTTIIFYGIKDVVHCIEVLLTMHRPQVWDLGAHEPSPVVYYKTPTLKRWRKKELKFKVVVLSYLGVVAGLKCQTCFKSNKQSHITVSQRAEW